MHLQANLCCITRQQTVCVFVYVCVCVCVCVFVGGHGVNSLWTSSFMRLLSLRSSPWNSSEQERLSGRVLMSSVCVPADYLNYAGAAHTHSREICEPVLPALLHNGHKRTFKWSYRWNHELKVKTYIKQISCDTKSICFNSFTHVLTLPDEAEGWWFLTVYMGDVTPPT